MAYVNEEIIADKCVDWFGRLIGSARTEAVIRTILAVIAGWFIGYLQFRFQFPG